MLINSRLRLLLGFLAFGVTTFLPAQVCGIQEPQKSLVGSESSQSVRLNAALIGFSEFTSPSTPPKKYRRQDLSSALKHCINNSPDCSAPGNASERVFAGSYVYDKADGSVTNTQTRSDYTIIPASGSSYSWNSTDPATTLRVTASVDPVPASPGFYLLHGYSGVFQSNQSNAFIRMVIRNSAGVALVVAGNNNGSAREFDARQVGAGSTIEFIDAGSQQTVGGTVQPWQTGEPCGGEATLVSTISLGESYATPFFVPGGTSVAMTKTKATFAADGICGTNGSGTKQSGSMIKDLSDEDTEDDALQRVKSELAKPAADRAPGVVVEGSDRTASFTTRTSGFTFSLQRTRYEATFAINCPGRVTYQVNYRVDGAGRSATFEKTHQSSGPATISVNAIPDSYRDAFGQVPPATFELKVTEPNKVYTIDSIEIISACTSGQNPGDAGHALGSIHSHFSLGRGLGGAFGGEIQLKADNLVAALYSPVALGLAAPSDGSVTVVRDSAGMLRQVKAAQALADLVVLNAAAYEIRLYAIDEVGAADADTGVFAVSGTPYVVHRIENPDLSGAPRLRLTETRSSQTKVTEYTHDAVTGTWTLSAGNGLRRESVAETRTATTRTTTSTVRNPDSTIATKVTRAYRTFPGDREELTSEILDPDGAALTTTRSFDTQGRLLSLSRPDGSWERYADHDSLGRPLKTIRPFLGAGPAAPETDCRVTENSYTTLADADGDELPEQLTTTIERTLGTETGRTYGIEWSKPVALGAETFARRTDIRCVAAGAAWNAPDNLGTETLAYAAGPLLGRTRRVLNPDGTATFTAYTLAANGEQTTIAQTGAPNATLDAILDGTRTVSVTSAQGQLVAASTTDIASGLTLTAWTATQFDALGRPARLDHSDGTYETRDYACCGLASARDRTGVLTIYEYDALGRQTHVTRDGVTTRTTHDADGRVKTLTRIGTDSTEMLQETRTYDLAGRLTETRDALNRLTTTGTIHDAGTGRTTQTTIAPDGGTTIEITARTGARLSVTGTAAAPRAYEYGLESGQRSTKEIRVGEGGATTEWTKSFTDFAGRTFKTVLADNATTQSYFNAAGQLVRQVDPDGVTTLFAYNARGEPEDTALDLDGNGLIDYAGTDRITRTLTEIAQHEGHTVQRTTTQVWEAAGSPTPTTVSVTEQTTDGLRSWQTVRGLTTTTITVLDGAGGRIVTTIAPDGVQTIQVYAGDRLTAATVKTAGDAQLGAATYGYDAHHRQISATDARTGTTSFAYYADDQLQSTTTPDPDPVRTGPGYDPQTTAFTHDVAGRVNQVTEPDGGIKTTEYYHTGLVKKYTGARQYPEERTYDAQGRLQTLTTWQDHAGGAGAAVTTWNYDPVRGWLTSKQHADGQGPSYAYQPSGRLASRLWARGVQTNYAYNAAGEPTGTTYSDGTPAVTLTYDRAGRPKTITDASGTRSHSYDASGQLKDEDYTAGLLATLGVHRTFDALQRLDSLSAFSATSALNQIGFSYDAASRLDSVSNGANTAAYTYAPNSPLVSSVTFTNSGTPRLTTTKVYDNLNRLTSITNTPSASSALSAFYQYNTANQRTKLTREDSSYWDYGYDPLGQVTSAKKFTAAATAVLGHDFTWAFDNIGNRKTATINTQASTYSSNSLNQYSQRTVPGAIDIIGEAQPDANVFVTVGTAAPQSVTRQGSRFFKQLAIDNSASGVGSPIKVTGVKNLIGPNGEDAVTELDRFTFTPKTPEIFTYDADGNLIADARWTYTWDGENRLKTMETAVGAVAPNGPLPAAARQRLEFAYDGQGRRVGKKVYEWAGSAWTLDSSLLFLYDGWNMIAELDAMSSNALTRSHVWGLDLSGTMQGAGGVGGLLFTNFHLPTASSHAPAFDGNANVIGYVDMATGVKSATYEYNAFGEAIIADGVAAEAMPFRFSTKYRDNETGLIFFPHRPYQAPTGRFMARDPLGEPGASLLDQNISFLSPQDALTSYVFVQNDPVGSFDPYGLFTVDEAKKSLQDRRAASGIKTREYTAKDLFEEWLRLEKGLGAWWKKLPQCPKKLCVDGSGKAKNPDNSIWADPESSGIIADFFHPGTSFEMRTKAGATGTPCGNQCTYDQKGELITAYPGAGTVDLVGPNNSFTGHLLHDVNTYYLAVRAGRANDYYSVRPLW